MNTILFKVNGNRIRRTNGFEPTSGEKNYSQLKFVFDEEWEGVPAVSVLQFFDESDIPEPIVKEITDNTVVVPVNEKLRGKEGILHIGVAGAKADGTTMDTRIIHVPVGEGFKLCGNESTLMYLNLLAYVARLLDATITEDNPLTSERLAKGSVREEHIKDGAVTSEKIAGSSIDYYHLKAGAVKTASLDKKSVTGEKISDNSIGENHLSENSVTPNALDRMYVEFLGIPFIKSYAELNGYLTNAEDHQANYCFYRFGFDKTFPKYGLFGDDIYMGYIAGLIGEQNDPELILTNTRTFEKWRYIRNSAKFEQVFLSDVLKKEGVFTNAQLDALDNLFDLTAYTSDKSKDAYEAFVKAFGLDNYRVQREFTIDELFPCGLSFLREANITGAVMSEYGYYTKQGTNRYSYIYFDIPCKYGYTYKFNFETTQSTDNIAIELYNEYALNQVEAEGDYRSADHKEYNWIGNGGEITPPEFINGFATAGLRFVFNTGTPGVTRIKISKKRVI